MLASGVIDVDDGPGRLSSAGFDKLYATRDGGQHPGSASHP